MKGRGLLITMWTEGSPQSGRRGWKGKHSLSQSSPVLGACEHRPQAGLSGSLLSLSVTSTFHPWEPGREAGWETDENPAFQSKWRRLSDNSSSFSSRFSDSSALILYSGSMSVALFPPLPSWTKISHFIHHLFQQ